MCPLLYTNTIENNGEIKDILVLAKKYFDIMKKEKGKKYIVTFSGNNDFTVINYLFEKFGIDYKVQDNFISVDLQKEYESTLKTGIGLKALEKIFEIEREGEVISGSNLAKTFHKVIKDDDYILRMPREKIDKILLYNEMDVVNLFHICLNWSKYINSSQENPNEEKRDNNITGISY
ncbi:putative exonuclease [Clostridium fallax]|uniref:RNase_H superfamily protein n=1 Tax=Clostridium fallax TaxID=1533 RepID=A0A1M4YY90_9CLOT|nr:RNase_H superfamily protein [Clostridium fallax]SQB07388.1 putative exonuclease [Clostridium fallax]